eukprot:406306_1
MVNVISYVFLFYVLYLTTANIILIDTISLNWHEADNYCRQSNIGGHLATVTSITNNIRQQLSLLPSKSRVWIGLIKDYNSDAYTWIDETQCTDSTTLCTTLWSNNQPSTINNCVAINDKGQFMTRSCDEAKYFFCNEATNPSETTTTTTTSSSIMECGRHRKPWHELTEIERNLYINGVLELSKSGKLQIFTANHANEIASRQAHDTSAFLPWHRLFIWELETAIRSLDGKYKCFSLPYWDWTYEIEQYGLNFHEYHILNSGLGGNGNERDNYCINDGSIWSKDINEYIPYDCSYQGQNGKCCLSRHVCDNNGNGCNLASVADLIGNIVLYDTYGSDTNTNSKRVSGYREILESEIHNSVHNVMGGSGHLGDAFTSPDDPIFYLMHAFIDFNWALWQDCHDFDLIEKHLTNNNAYIGTLNKYKSNIDHLLIFNELSSETWTFVSQYAQTPRDMFLLNEWNVSYEKG